jgi:hypothetical protein
MAGHATTSSAQYTPATTSSSSQFLITYHVFEQRQYTPATPEGTSSQRKTPQSLAFCLGFVSVFFPLPWAK